MFCVKMCMEHMDAINVQIAESFSYYDQNRRLYLSARTASLVTLAIRRFRRQKRNGRGF